MTSRWIVGVAARGAVYGAILLGIVIAAYFIFTAAPPAQSTLWERNKIQSVTILDRNEERLAVRGAFYGEMIPLEELPDHLVEAFLAIEDRRFFSHIGLDFRGLARAAWVNFQAGSLVQGGSTITQQLAKNLFLSSERTYRRKIQELGLALWLERHLTKDEILTLYLNRIYLGAGTYGIDAAAQFYFGKSARDVTLAEAAMLAGLPKAPARYAPTSDLTLAQNRADLVLDAMVQAGYVDAASVYQAKAQPAAPIERPNRDGLQYFVDYIVQEAERLLADAPPQVPYRHGVQVPDNLVVRTTLDPGLQAIGEATLVRHLDTSGPLDDVEQGALVTLDLDGAVRAMVGGRAYGESQFNRVTQARRQPGSAFKPFVYLAALESGLTPDTLMWDEPTKVGDWTPENYSGTYRGRVSLRESLEHSLNTVAVQVSEQIGRTKVIEAARRMGIASPLAANRSLPLGTSEVSLLELSGAYLEFARQGMSAEPFALLRIETESGIVLWERPEPESQRVVEKAIAQDMTNMLYHVVQRGTGKAAQFGSWDLAGKTGTSQDWRDAWFVGYSGELLTGVWVGNDDDSPMDRVTGGGLPTRIWADFMAASHEEKNPVQLAGAQAVAVREEKEELRLYLLRLAEQFSQTLEDPRSGRPGGEKTVWEWFNWN